VFLRSRVWDHLWSAPRYSNPFVCPCLHSLVHLPREVVRLGPPVCSSQWTLKQTIGNVGEEIKQHSNPFSNLSQHGIRRAWVNACTQSLDTPVGHWQPWGWAVAPWFERPWQWIHASLCMRAWCPPPPWLWGYTLGKHLVSSLGPKILVQRWAKLRIPTGQNCYSAWKEKQKPLKKWRTVRNVKVRGLHAIISLVH